MKFTMFKIGLKTGIFTKGRNITHQAGELPLPFLIGAR
jgi:hypothetical protein